MEQSIKISSRKFQNQLLNWYDGHARILPWRDHPTPYQVWVSEIMLQQTRVQTVLPYFQHFIRDIPSVEVLAAIPEEKLLKYWEGLGYYHRALNMKKAAVLIMERFGGSLPSETAVLRTLPGIGPYTAGAIASIAFGKRDTAIDGNVIRVMVRITADNRDSSSKQVKNQVDQAVRALLPEERAGDFNQALMELGATVCLPGGIPECGACPVQEWCMGYSKGMASTLPVKKSKSPRTIQKKTVFLICAEGTFALRKRPPDGLLPNLWEFPSAEGHLPEEKWIDIMETWGIQMKNMVLLQEETHVFTHLEWHMKGGLITAQRPQDTEGFLWADRCQIREIYAVPAAYAGYANLLDRMAV